MNPFNVLSPLLEVLGDYAPKARTFIVDMHDAQGDDYFQEIYPLVPPDMKDTVLVYDLVQPFITQGRTIDTVVELLDGISYGEFNKLQKRNPEEARKRVKLHYVSPEYLQKVKP